MHIKPVTLGTLPSWRERRPGERFLAQYQALVYISGEQNVTSG